MLYSPKDDIWKATQRGDLEAVREFVERDGLPPVDEKDFGCQSLLTIACEAGHADIVRFLLERGAVANDSCYYSPEAFAAMRGGHLEVLRVLGEFSLNPNNKEYSKHGDTLINQAVEERRVEVVRLLLAYNGEIYTGHEDEATDEEIKSGLYPSPLELAARAGDVKFVQFLLEVGVELKGQDADYYLNKAQQNAPKFQQAQHEKEKAEEEQRVEWESAAKTENSSCFLGCIVCVVLALGLFWLLLRLMARIGWEAIAFGSAFVAVIYAVMRMSRWGQA